MNQPRSVVELCELLASGHDVSYLFFWGHRPPRDGTVGKGCLSQWFECPFEVDGVRYPTAEHFMMVEKARLFGDTDAAQSILAAATPKAAKAAGRGVRGFDESLWNAHRSAIVTRGNLAKFGQNDPLKRYLLSTGDRVLVEASPNDAVWGIGLAEDVAATLHPSEWKGLNLLGFALMAVREQLRTGPDAASPPEGWQG